jgi:anthranilate 1,2-dioxygenase large subunit
VGMQATTTTDRTGLHSALLVVKNAEENAGEYRDQKIRSYSEGFRLEDTSVLDMVQEYAELSTNHIQPIFPQLVIQQIHNTLVARQIIAKAHDRFELVFHFFGYADDTPELRAMRIRQANLVGPAGYISMEDTEATELVQRGVTGAGDALSILEMSRHAPDETRTMISEGLVRKFWVGYARLMGLEAQPA